MNSFLLISNSLEKTNSYLNEFYKDHTISLFDQTVIASETSIGIELIRKMQQSLYLAPYKGDKKAIVIEHAETLTVEAQNALLKILEEPPLFVYIFLVSTNSDVFLPTILSRCQIVVLEQNVKTISEETKQQLSEQLNILQNGTIGEKLALAEKIAAEKDQIKQWFEQMTQYAREKMLSNPTILAPTLISLQQAYKDYTTTNVSPRVILEHYFLDIALSS